jgi:integrase
MVRRAIGRSKGRSTKGYFYRAGRGWFTKADGRFIPLTDESGERFREKKVSEDMLKDASARVRVSVRATQPPVRAEAQRDAQVGEVCRDYLSHLKAQADLSSKQGIARTYLDRGRTLFDFCYGLPAKFFCEGDVEKRAKLTAKERPKKTHAGYGDRQCSELTPTDIDRWLAAHVWKSGGRRIRLQALRRAFNFAVERQVIAKNPIKGYKLPKATSRITYLTPAQEESLLKASSPAFALALKFCIRTGARFGCEFAALCGRHVKDHGDRMEWIFKADESKTKRQRIIRITDPEIIRVVRARMNDGPIFRNESGTPWSRIMLSQNFRRAKARIKKQGVSLDPDACMYSCRHTYAKRTLEGFWTGKLASIKTLARLMGNTVQVCIDHYLQFSEADNEGLWETA